MLYEIVNVLIIIFSRYICLFFFARSKKMRSRRALCKLFALHFFSASRPPRIGPCRNQGVVPPLGHGSKRSCPMNLSGCSRQKLCRLGRPCKPGNQHSRGRMERDRDARGVQERKWRDRIKLLLLSARLIATLSPSGWGN